MGEEKNIEISFYNIVDSKIESFKVDYCKKNFRKNERDEMNILRNLAFCRKRNWEDSIFSTIRERLELTLGMIYFQIFWFFSHKITIYMRTRYSK